MLHRRASFGTAVPTATTSRRSTVVAFYLLISVSYPPTLENGSATTARGPSICMDFNLKVPWPAVDPCADGTESYGILRIDVVAGRRRLFLA